MWKKNGALRGLKNTTDFGTWNSWWTLCVTWLSSYKKSNWFLEAPKVMEELCVAFQVGQNVLGACCYPCSRRFELCSWPKAFRLAYELFIVSRSMICMGVPFVGVTSSFTCRRFDYNTKHEYAQSGPCCVTPGQIQKLMSIVIYDSPMRNWTGTTNFTRESVLATIFSVLNLRRSRETPLMSKPKCLKNLALQIPCIHGIAKKKNAAVVSTHLPSST